MIVTRDRIVECLTAALQPLEHVTALSEAGSAAFGRLDEWSDIDLMVDADDGREADVLAVVEQALAGLSPIELRFEMPQPAWHGMAQCFYRLEGSSEFLLVDLCVRPVSKAGSLTEREQHGRAVVYFDKSGITAPRVCDRAKLGQDIAARVGTLKATFPLFANLAKKEALRGRDLDALYCYHAMVLRPLVEVLRMRYDAPRYNFGMRYLDFDLPPEVVERLRRLAFVTDAADILAKYEEARAWFEEELKLLQAAK